MITVGMNYNVLEGKKDVFETAFRNVINALKNADGHTKSNMFCDIDDAQNYLIISDWDDKNKFDDFISSETFKKVTNWGKEQILAGRPTHKVYTS